MPGDIGNGSKLKAQQHADSAKISSINHPILGVILARTAREIPKNIGLDSYVCVAGEESESIQFPKNEECLRHSQGTR